MVQWQELGEGERFAAILHVALVFRDDEGEAGDFSREVAELDAAEVGEREVGGAVSLAAAVVDFRLNGAEFLVGDDEEISRTAGGIEDADAGEALAEIEQLAGIFPSLIQAGAELVEEQRVEHLEDVRHAGVVHAEGAALLVIRHGLDHGAEDVRVDLGPVQRADVDQIGAGDLGEAGHIERTGEQPAIDVGEDVCPRLDLRRIPVAVVQVSLMLHRSIHRPEEFLDHLVGDRMVSRAHLLDGGGEQTGIVEDAGVFRKKAEDQAGHEVVHVAVALLAAPVGIFAEEFHVKAVQAASGADVEGVFPDLLHGGDPGKRQEEAKMIREGRVVAGDCFAIGEVFCLKRDAIGGEDELGLLLGRGRTISQGCKRGGDFALWADVQVDVVALEDAAGEVGGVGTGFPLSPEALEGGVFVSEGFAK